VQVPAVRTPAAAMSVHFLSVPGARFKTRREDNADDVLGVGGCANGGVAVIVAEARSLAAHNRWAHERDAPPAEEHG
jgi:hypothetical protein